MRFHSGALASAILVVASASLSAEAFCSPGASTFVRSGGGTSTALYGVKRGRLASNVSPDGVTSSPGKKKGKNKKAKLQSGKKASATANAAFAAAAGKAKPASKGISSSLADWAATADDTPAATAEAPKVEVEEEPAVAAASFDVFPDEEPAPAAAPQRKGKRGKKQKQGGGGGDRRSRQAERVAVESARRSAVTSAVSDLKDLLDPPEDEDGNKPKPKTSFDVSYVLDKIRTLQDNPPDKGPRALIAGNARTNYRLAWAGSDTSVCALCSGLHNVPLARLQEVFCTLGGGGRIEVLEVIRILGPFPNVRNTLKGDAKVDGKTGRLSIAYDSMIDGTGKEIPAPANSADGIRRVGLDVLYADEYAVVCAVPAEEEGEESEDPLTGDGSRVLLFFNEDDLDGQLNKNRVL